MLRYSIMDPSLYTKVSEEVAVQLQDELMEAELDVIFENTRVMINDEVYVVENGAFTRYDANNN